MDTLPPYLIYQILKRSTFEDRLLTLQYVNSDWRRWTPLTDLRTLKVSDFERLRVNPSVWRRQTPSSTYFESNQKWLETLFENIVPRAGAGIKKIHMDSAWPRVNDVPPLFCAPEGFKRWKLTRPLLALIERHCGRNLEELNLIEENFVYTELEPEAYSLLTGFPNLRRLAIARVDATFGPCLRQLSLTSLAISGEKAPMDTADPDKLKSLHLSHPFPEIYRNHANFYLSRHFPNLENHSEQLLVELDQLSEMAQRKRLADYRQLPNFKWFRIQLGPENGVSTELQSIAGYGLPKLQGAVNLRVTRVCELANNIRFLGQLRHIRVEGLLGQGDALALFTSLPELEHLTLACHWLTDEQNEEIGIDAEESDSDKQVPKETPKLSLAKLRNLRLTLYEQAPTWLRSLLKDAFGASKALRSLRLQNYSDEEKNSPSGPLLLEDVGLSQIRGHLKQLDCRIGAANTCKRHLSTILQGQWPKLTSFTWHASQLQIDDQLVAEIANSFPNLKRFCLVPPGGPLRPLFPGNDPDEGLCQFQDDALTVFLTKADKLREIRLYATSSLDGGLGRAIADHNHLKTLKLWDSFVPKFGVLNSFLKQLNSGTAAPSDGGNRHKPLYVEVFTLRSDNADAVLELDHQLNSGKAFFLANGRSNAIDEQIFYFP